MEAKASAWRLQAVHTRVAGRARFKVAALYRAESLRPKVESRLNRLPGIRTVQVNPLTGSLLIHFDPKRTLKEMAAEVEAKLANLPVPARSRRRRSGWTERLQAGFDQIKGAASQSNHKTNNKTKNNPGHTAASNDPWHALSREEVLQRVEGSEEGLSSEAAAARLERFGRNALPTAERRSDLSILLEQFITPPVAMLGVSAVVSIATGGIVDAGAIVTIVLVNAAIGFVTERQSETIIAALTPTGPRQVTVRRDGRMQRLSKDELVPGDVIELSPGSYVAADLRILESERLSLDESALTGESMPVEKEAKAECQEDIPLGDRRNMAYMGTAVTGGSGMGLVVSTGLNTEIGQIQTMAEGARPPEALVERQLDELGRQLVILSSAICAGVFFVGLLRGHTLIEMLKASISLGVAAVPEGLPTVATTTLAIGIRNMRRRNVQVRRLDAIETLGSVQVFCLDKTGTLTVNRMTVVALQVGLRDIKVDERGMWAEGHKIESSTIPELRRLLEIVVLCSETELEQGQVQLKVVGSATETALVELAIGCDVNAAALRDDRPRVSIQHRAEDRPYMVTVHRLDDGRRLVAVKGSPEELLGFCRWYLQDDERKALGDDERTRVLRANEQMAGEALRVLGVAYAIREEGDTEKDNAENLENLVWLGLTGMADPLRPGMTELLGRFHQAGIATSMITGDQSATAYAIARQLDLADGQSVEILDSMKLEKLDPEVLKGVIQKVQVFSRVSPTHKLRIVRALQEAGKIVAMTGDGVNDGPALKAADLGVAMGGTGSEVARSVADVVIEDDNLTTMVVAIRDGRTIYDNIRKAIRFLLATNLSEIEVMLVSIGVGLGSPLNPMQLLWINLATDVFPGLALAMEAPEPDVLERPPRDPQRPIIDRQDLTRLGLESGVISASALISYLAALLRYGPGPKANTHAFMTLTTAQLLHSLSSRSEEHSLFFDRERLPRNRYLELALGGSLAAQALTVLVPGLRRLLGTTPLTLADSAIVTASAAVPLLINEATKKLWASGPDHDAPPEQAESADAMEERS